ncbi:MAG: sugar phosphate isomerase/epimerase [Armatimonadetes bacterium]|nr:sugar phosphate isomerase/epimerase [Armatimonadota bacterium]
MSKIGLQLIVYGGRQNDDLAGVLAEVKAVGYDGAETGPMYPALGTDAVINIFKDAGLALTGIHCGYGDMADEAKVKDHIAFLQAAGSRFLICSGVADNNSIAGYEASADTFNQVGQMCVDAGLVFCYHNHAWEFKPLEEGKQGIYTLIERTDPKVVKLNIDVFWVHIGGANPAAFIAQYSDRAGYYHFKDGQKTADGQTFLELGRGDVDLVGAKDEALKHPLDWIVCEQDRTTLEPQVSIKQSFDYLKSIGL